MIRLKNIFLAGVVVSVLMGGLVSSAFAATSTAPDIMGQLEAGSGAAGYGTNAQDPRLAVAGGVKIFLSILGTIFLLLVVYGGFIMFTAAGNEENVGKAKKIIISAVIGLVIIMSAYSITNFVVSRILSETTTL